jgi:hypothetical protein
MEEQETRRSTASTSTYQTRVLIGRPCRPSSPFPSLRAPAHSTDEQPASQQKGGEQNDSSESFKDNAGSHWARGVLKDEAA